MEEQCEARAPGKGPEPERPCRIPGLFFHVTYRLPAAYKAKGKT
jgi:hypothetical protein